MEIKKAQLGIIGSILLMFGTLVPIVSVPIAGSQNYFQNGNGGGLIVIALGLAGIAFVVAKKFQALIPLGIATAALTTFTLVSVLKRISDAKSQLEASLEGNPFAGLAAGIMNSVQIEWGWLVLYLGAAALISSGVMARRESQKSDEPQPPQDRI